jgi:hypothetical protein
MAAAQVMMEPQLPSQGLLQQNQLWNILVVNNGDAVSGGVLQLSFQEEGSGRKIFSAVSGPIYLPKGPSQLSVKDMGAVQYDYLSSSYSSVSSSGGLLPIGRFIACYTLLESTPKGQQLLAQDCLPLAVEPFSPPQLSNPGDGSEVSASYPLFSWIPPAPVNMFNNLTYKMMLTEVLHGQTPSEALQRNPLLFMEVGLKDVSLAYPSSYTGLQAGKTYAWQILAQNDNTYAAATPVWSFKMTIDTLSVLLDRAAYPHLQRGAGNTDFVVQQKMKFSYDNEANDSSLTARLYTYDGGLNRVVYTKGVTLKPGLNFIDLDLSGVRSLSAGTVYVLEMVNGRQENWDIRFKYQPATE